MPLRSCIHPHRRRRAVQRLVAAGCLVAAASGAVVLDAAALGTDPATAGEVADTGAEPERTVAVTPVDRVELGGEDELALAMAEALEARLALTATEPQPSGRVPAETWDRLARCESGGNWSINTGNGYYGGLQFALSSWRWVGGTGYPHEASRETQIEMAERLLERQGWNAWPACSRRLGLR